MAKKALVVIAIILLIFGYPVNVVFALVRIASPGEVYRALFMASYALLYLLCWVLLLFVGLKRNSKTLQNLYQVFWLVTPIYFAALPHAPRIPPPAAWLDGLLAIGWFIFAAPLVGLDALAFYIMGRSLHSTGLLYISFAFSLFMFLFGFLMRLIRRKRSTSS